MKPTPKLRTTEFPPAWTWWSDELLPSWVKRNYSPRDSWKNKPFTTDDARFFGQGIEDLSELFTEARPKDLAGYFKHPKFRSSYLLYFLPLQAAKFLALFQQHAEAVDAALKNAQSEKRPLRVLDVGAGPGTASFGLVFALLERATLNPAAELPELEFHWIDQQEQILKDGASLLAELAEGFPRLRGRIGATLHRGDWLRALQPTTAKAPPPQRPTLPESFDLVLLGNVLNESIHPDKLALAINQLRAKTRGAGGVLMVEPAFKASAQRLSHVRDAVLCETQSPEEDSPDHDSEEGSSDSDFLPTPARTANPRSSLPALGPKVSPVWGPCLHAGRCPLAQGRDWCHFSVPVEIPGRWFRSFSRGLGSERNWLKYSYLWLAAPGAEAPASRSSERLIVSDTLPAPRSGDSSVLVCEPEITRRWILPLKAKRFRGERVTLGAEKALPSGYQGTGPSRSFRADERDPAGPPEGASGSRGGREQVGSRGGNQRRSPANPPHKRTASTGRRARTR